MQIIGEANKSFGVLMFVGPTAARVSKWTKIYIVVTYVYPSGAQYSIPIKAYA